MAPKQTSLLHKIVERAPELAAVTKDKYLRDLDAWIRFAGEDPKGWTSYKAEEFYQSLLSGLKPQSANRLFASIRYASKWWAHHEHDPYKHFAVIRQQKTPRDENTLRRPLSQDEATALLKTCRNRFKTPFDVRDLALMVVGLETGMRRMSLAAMDISNIGPLAGHGYPVAAVPIKGSRGNLYSVPLSDTALLALSPWLAWLKTRGVTNGAVFRRITRIVPPNSRDVLFKLNGSGITETMIHKIVVKRGTQAGLQKTSRHIHPHLFRHTFLTWRTDTIPREQMASITGHTLPEFGAMGRYIDLRTVGAKARNSTPPWLADLVKELVKQ